MKLSKKQYKNKSNLQKPYCDNIYMQYTALKQIINEKYSPYYEQQRTMYEAELKELAKRLGI